MNAPLIIYSCLPFWSPMQHARSSPFGEGTFALLCFLYEWKMISIDKSNLGSRMSQFISFMTTPSIKVGPFQPNFVTISIHFFSAHSLSIGFLNSHEHIMLSRIRPIATFQWCFWTTFGFSKSEWFHWTISWKRWNYQWPTGRGYRPTDE